MGRRRYRTDGDALVDLIRETYGAVAPETTIDLKFQEVAIDIEDLVTEGEEPKLGSVVALKGLRLIIKMQSAMVDSGYKRLCFAMDITSQSLSFKPSRPPPSGGCADPAALNKAVPLMNDGSACAIVHRLEDVTSRDTRVDDDGLSAPGRATAGPPPMLELRMSNYAIEDFASPEGRSEVDLKLRDVIMVVLPTQLSVALKSIGMALDTRVLKGGPAFVEPQPVGVEMEEEMEEGYFDDDDESDGSDFDYLRGRVESFTSKDRSSTNTSADLDLDAVGDSEGERIHLFQANFGASATVIVDSPRHRF